jgi:hypothetical protein
MNMVDKNESKQENLKCPYCDDEIAELQYPCCDACKVEYSICPECKKPVSKKIGKCPACGAEILRK